MRHLAAALVLGRHRSGSRAPEDRRFIDEWRAFHRRPDGAPDPVEPVPAFRRLPVGGSVVRLRRPADHGA
jgi:hypothetical protein